MSSCSPASATTRSSTSATTPSTRRSAASTAWAPTALASTAAPSPCKFPSAPRSSTLKPASSSTTFASPTSSIVIARGGRGGRGNQHFATSTHQAPREHELGRAGEERSYRLELKLLADVGLVGYPNAGKSTLISRISAARPKIADYPFTTLEPNLGVVTVGEEPDQQSFVIADMPGLIEGAHLGAGLGVQFLRHIERTRVLAHLVDVSDASGRPDPVEDFKVIANELASFAVGSEHPLAQKPTIVVATKIDAANPAKLKKLAAYAKRSKLEFHAVSAVTGEGIDELKWALAKRVRPEKS